MLSKNTVLMTRKAIESSYDSAADIFEKTKVINSSITKFKETKVHSDIKCRLSYNSIGATANGEANATVTQIIKLFMAPEVEVKPGSVIHVNSMGITKAYKCSGKPAVYPTHQEIVLDILENKA